MPLIYLSEDSIVAASAALLLMTKKDDFMGGPTLGELVNIKRALAELNQPAAPSGAGVPSQEVRATIESLLLREREEFEYAAGKKDEWLSSADERKRLSMLIAVERVAKIDAARAWLAALGAEA